MSGSCRLSRNDTGYCIMKQTVAISFRKFLFTFNCVYVCGYVCVSTSAPGGKKGLLGVPGAGVTDGCRLPDVAPDAGTDPVQEQQVP